MAFFDNLDAGAGADAGGAGGDHLFGVGQIANAAGGEAFRGDPEEIAAVYRQISSFF